MKIAFTGTRKGMTDKQKETFISLLKRLPPITEFHDGNCKGSDLTSRRLTLENAKQKMTFHIHPSIYNKFVIPFKSSLYTFNHTIVKHPVKQPLERNHDMVDVIYSEDEPYCLIATPAGDEIVRSGTWATIRYAKKQNPKIGIKVLIIYPDGELIETF